MYKEVCLALACALGIVFAALWVHYAYMAEAPKIRVCLERKVELSMVPVPNGAGGISNIPQTKTRCVRWGFR